jgi:hypothetical protein
MSNTSDCPVVLEINNLRKQYCDNFTVDGTVSDAIEIVGGDGGRVECTSNNVLFIISSLRLELARWKLANPEWTTPRCHIMDYKGKLMSEVIIKFLNPESSTTNFALTNLFELIKKYVGTLTNASIPQWPITSDAKFISCIEPCKCTQMLNSVIDFLNKIIVNGKHPFDIAKIESCSAPNIPRGLYVQAVVDGPADLDALTRDVQSAADIAMEIEKELFKLIKLSNVIVEQLTLNIS